MEDVLIGVGSNLQDPAKQVLQAIDALKSLPESRFVQASRLYRSSPQGPQDQPDFVNAVVWLQTDLSPRACLLALQALEQAQGKVKKRHWGERLIDLDIVLFGDLEIDEPDLQVPHPQMWQRDFVLLPLQELQPDRVLKGRGIHEWVADLTHTFVVPD